MWKRIGRYQQITRQEPFLLYAPPAAPAYVLLVRILARSGMVNLMLVTFLIPVSAILLGSLVLGETLLVRHFAGMALIAAGLACIDGRLLRRQSPSNSTS